MYETLEYFLKSLIQDDIVTHPEMQNCQDLIQEIRLYLLNIIFFEPLTNNCS